MSLKSLLSLTKDKEIIAKVEKNYLASLTIAGYKSISDLSFPKEVASLGSFKHKKCLFIPTSRTRRYLVINPEIIKQNLKNNPEYYSFQVKSWKDVCDFLYGQQLSSLVKKFNIANMTHSEYLYTMGKLMGYPEESCRIFSLEVGEDQRKLREDRIAVRSKILAPGNSEVSIIAYKKGNSLNTALEIIALWDKYYQDTFGF